MTDKINKENSNRNSLITDLKATILKKVGLHCNMWTVMEDSHDTVIFQWIYISWISIYFCFTNSSSIHACIIVHVLLFSSFLVFNPCMYYCIIKYTPQNSSIPPVIPPPVTSTVTRVVTPTPVVDQGTPLPDPGLVGALNDLKADFDQYKKKQQQLITLLEKTDEDIINNHTKEVLVTTCIGALGEWHVQYKTRQLAPFFISLPVCSCFSFTTAVVLSWGKCTSIWKSKIVCCHLHYLFYIVLWVTFVFSKIINLFS